LSSNVRGDTRYIPNEFTQDRGLGREKEIFGEDKEGAAGMVSEETEVRRGQRGNTESRGEVRRREVRRREVRDGMGAKYMIRTGF
jgi:hypothetical protein